MNVRPMVLNEKKSTSRNIPKIEASPKTVNLSRLSSNTNPELRLKKLKFMKRLYLASGHREASLILWSIGLSLTVREMFLSLSSNSAPVRI